LRILTEIGLSTGIDLSLIKQAKTKKKPVEDLEILEQYKQINKSHQNLTMDPIKIILIQLLLISSRRSKEPSQTSAYIKVLLAQASHIVKSKYAPHYVAWEEGNLDPFDYSKIDPTNKRMDITQRNKNMAMRIASLVNSSETIFCCVGVGHTAGKDNVQNFLQNHGLTTERVFI